MSDPERFAEEQGHAGVRSGVKLEQTSKGPIQVKVNCYEGTTEAEMQRLKDIAVRTLTATVNEINALAGFSTT